MSESDRTRSELLKELRDVRGRLERLEKERAAEPGVSISRREILKAAWVSPIILSLGLPSGAGCLSRLRMRSSFSRETRLRSKCMDTSDTPIWPLFCLGKIARAAVRVSR